MDYEKQILVPGILGGMGPKAHIYFEELLLQARKSSTDQANPAWILASATQVPDRTGSYADPAACIAELVGWSKRLEKAGVDFLVVVCNTSHIYYDQVQSQLQIPWLHLIKLTHAYILQRFSVQAVGLLATTGTVKSQIYHSDQFDLITPKWDASGQERVMEIIYDPEWGLKTSRVTPQAIESLAEQVRILQQQGAELIILGCTEFSILQPYLPEFSQILLDPLRIAARQTLDLAYGHSPLTSLYDQ